MPDNTFKVRSTTSAAGDSGGSAGLEQAGRQSEAMAAAFREFAAAHGKASAEVLVLLQQLASQQSSQSAEIKALKAQLSNLRTQ